MKSDLTVIEKEHYKIPKKNANSKETDEEEARALDEQLTVIECIKDSERTNKKSKKKSKK